MSFPNRPFPVPGRLKPSTVVPSGNSTPADSTAAPPEFSESNAEVVLSSLRAAIAARASEPTAILKAIAEAAQALTSATGAALALRRDGVVVCCARSGETAPDVGTRLSGDSGISGECLRSGEALRCDDAYTDHRVDPMVCRVLGLRSIATVPLCDQGHVVGILETFSTRPYAFSERHMGFLGQLAGLTEAAQPPERPAEKPVHVDAPQPAAPTFGSTWSTETTNTVATRLLERLQIAKRRRRLAAVGVVTLALLSMIGWWTLHSPETPVVQPAAASYAEVVPPEPSEEIVLATPVAQPQAPAQHPKAKPETHAARRPRRGHQAKEEDPDVVVRKENPPEQAILTPPASIHKTRLPASSPNPEITEPQIVLVPSDNVTLGGLLAASPPTPKLYPPISSGVSPAILEHKVAPIYPANAVAMGLKGAVVLQVTISEEGKVRGLKVVDGNPVLARAAMEAVRQWRYRPSILNGKPTEAQTQVTVNFLLP
jgi:TonB family protein